MVTERKMKYKEFQDAPEDHCSEEFLEYLRNKNTVIAEDDDWILIENYIYHKPEARHYTAFNKQNNVYTIPWYLYTFHCFGWQILVNAIVDRSVDRWHVHFIEKFED